MLPPGRAVAVPRTAGAPAGLSQAARLPAARAARTGRPSPAYTPPLGNLARADRSRPVAVRRNPEVTPRDAPPDEATRLQPRSTISGARSRADQWGSAPRGLSAIPRQPAGPAERQFSVPPRNQFSVPPQPGFSTASRPLSVPRREYSAPPAGQPPSRSAPSAAPRSAPPAVLESAGGRRRVTPRRRVSRRRRPRGRPLAARLPCRGARLAGIQRRDRRRPGDPRRAARPWGAPGPATEPAAARALVTRLAAPN